MERALNILIGIVVLFLVVIIAWFIIEFYEMVIDHQCYMMDDVTFYNEPMCRKYWPYRE